MVRKISLLEKSEMIFPPPQVFITLEAMQKIQYFALLASREINGRGWVERNENNFIVADAFILKQAADDKEYGVEEDPMAFNQFVAKCSREQLLKLRFQWHSHADISVFYSPTDKDTIREHPTDFMISLIINKRGEYRCRLDLYKPFYVGFEVPLLVIVPRNEKLLEFCRQEIKEKVRQKDD